MSKIITLPTDRQDSTSASAIPHGGAEIVIFPGVRIERREFNLADRHVKPRRAKPSAKSSKQ